MMTRAKARKTLAEALDKDRDGGELGATKWVLTGEASAPLSVFRRRHGGTTSTCSAESLHSIEWDVVLTRINPSPIYEQKHLSAKGRLLDKNAVYSDTTLLA